MPSHLQCWTLPLCRQKMTSNAVHCEPRMNCRVAQMRGLTQQRNGPCKQGKFECQLPFLCVWERHSVKWIARFTENGSQRHQQSKQLMESSQDIFLCISKGRKGEENKQTLKCSCLLKHSSLTDGKMRLKDKGTCPRSPGEYVEVLNQIAFKFNVCLENSNFSGQPPIPWSFFFGGWGGCFLLLLWQRFLPSH